MYSHPDKVFDHGLGRVFVFGSNLGGYHGGGAALYAVKRCGAIYGAGIGRQGNAYAIPTKDERIRTLPLDEIAHYVRAFLVVARDTPHVSYFVTRIGCGLAGYQDEDIAPMFSGAPANVELPTGW